MVEERLFQVNESFMMEISLQEHFKLLLKECFIMEHNSEALLGDIMYPVCPDLTISGNPPTLVTMTGVL